MNKTSRLWYSRRSVRASVHNIGGFLRWTDDNMIRAGRAVSLATIFIGDQIIRLYSSNGSVTQG